MDIIMKNYNGVTLVSTEARLLQSRKIFLRGDISEKMMVDFFQVLQILEEDDDQSPMSVYIDSLGGEVRSGLAMYYMIAGCKMEMNLYVLGKAFSMAAVLLAAGKEGHRFLMPYSEVMIHEPVISSRVGGTVGSVRSISDSLQESKDLIDGILAKHTGHSIEEVREATSFDHYFKAQEAVEWGLADRIVGFEEMM